MVIAGKHLPLFTRDDNMVRLLRAAVIEAGKTHEYFRELCRLTGCDWGYDVLPDEIMLLVQAMPAQQVEAALRALGKWQEENE